MGLSRERRLEGIWERPTGMRRWPSELLGGQEPPRTRNLFFQGQNTSVMGVGAQKTHSSTLREEKITSSENTNSSYQNIHLQRLMLERPRSDRGGCKWPEAPLPPPRWWLTQLREGTRHRAFYSHLRVVGGGRWRRDMIHGRDVKEQPRGYLKEECSKQSSPSKSKGPS